MSHAEERKEKNCLNCGTSVAGRYCQNCGQENVVPHETFGHMVKHFFYDITHFDSKFLDSVKYLVAKPGFLSSEYMRGRRAHYLNPIKMYVFTSAIFFLIFFSVVNVGNVTQTSLAAVPTQKEIEKVERFMLSNASSKKDSNEVMQLVGLVKKDTTKQDTARRKTTGVQFNFTNQESDYETVEEYDSVQKTLSSKDRDNWFMRTLTRRSLQHKKKYQDENALSKAVITTFLHSFPYILFVSLPLYALFLKLLYIRNKKYFFVDHGIFLVHLYIFTFLLMLIFIGLSELDSAFNLPWLGWFQAALVIYGIWYTFRGLRNFYGQGFWKTFLKFLMFNLLCLISISVLFAAFLMISVFRV